jgi:hypothetical protein
VISTQAENDNDLLSLLLDDALAGHDPHTVCSLYTAPPDADPFTIAAIKQANPALGVFQNADELLTCRRRPVLQRRAIPMHDHFAAGRARRGLHDQQ